MSGAGIRTQWDITLEMSDEEWNRMIGVHLNGTFFCTREALKLMAAKNQGAIISMSSVAALAGAESAPRYSAAKGAMLSFARALVKEVASRNIRVNALCPGWIETPMADQAFSPTVKRALLSRILMGRSGQPRQVAMTALFLAPMTVPISPGSGYHRTEAWSSLNVFSRIGRSPSANWRAGSP